MDSWIIRQNIRRYEAMLAKAGDAKKRATIAGLLEAQRQLLAKLEGRSSASGRPREG